MTPIERLLALAAFLRTPLCQSLALTHVASIFAVREGKLDFSNEADSAWTLLPSEWRLWALRSSDQPTLLRKLAKSVCDEDMPASLRDFIKTSASLQLDRSCSDQPVLSSRPSPAARKRPRLTFDALGMKLKKAHEVDRCLGIVSELVEGVQGAQILDVGAGRAHLSRTLTKEPLNAHVLAVDNSESQIRGSDRLVEITNRFGGPLGLLNLPGGTLEHELNHLDESSLHELLTRWPYKSHVGPSLLLALHACGDLTVNSLRACVGAIKEGSEMRACIVGCCYNLLTDQRSSFPLSSVLAGTDLKLERDARMLAAQAPSQWLLDEGKMLSLRKLAMRARLGTELRTHGLCTATRNERVGRPADRAYESYELFRLIALERLAIKQELPALPLAQSWETLQFAVAFFWTIRALLGPVFESLIILDRYLYLVEELSDKSRTVELHALFDQSQDSLRNMALVVR